MGNHPPNERLRHVREVERDESRVEFARRVQAMADELGESVGIDARTIARWEDGDSFPRANYRRVLVALTGRTEEELGLARRRSGVPSERQYDMPTVERVERREFLTSAAAALAAPAPGRIVQAMPRTVDPALVEYFREQLQGHYRADMFLGPHHLLATVTAQHQLICELASAAAADLRRDLLRVGAAYAAMLGWLYQDAGAHTQSIRWRDITLDMAHRAHDTQLVGYALANKASLAADMSDPAGAVDLSDAALAEPSTLAPKVQIIARVHAAHGYSLMGDRRAVDYLLKGAEPLIDRIDDDLPWGDACRRTPSYVDVQRATCYTRMTGDPQATRDADRIWTHVLAGMPGGHRRDVAVFKARHAAVAAVAGEPDRALALVAEAADAAITTGSARARRELVTVREHMSPWAHDRYGRELDALLAATAWD